jgi:ABC-type glycerol-3-phosphate transport system substrate-binding protein
MMHKRIALGIVAIILVGFVAERRLNVYTARRGGVTTVRVMVDAWQYSEFMTPDKDLERCIRAFEKRHPEIKIDLRLMPEANEITLMLPWRADQTPFDLLLTTNNETIVRYAEGGFLQPLEELLKPELKAGLLGEFLPGYLQYCRLKDPRTREEHLYGLPWLGEIMALNYRKDVLRELGFPDDRIPATYAELEEYARRLRNPEKKIYGVTLDLSPGFFSQNAYVPVLQSYRGSVVDEKGRLDVSSPEARRTFETLKRWYSEGLMPKGALTPYQSADDFRAKIAIFFPNWQSRGFWAIRSINESVGPGLARAPGALTPGERQIGIGPALDSRRVGALVAHYIGVIPKASPVRKEAVQVLLEAFCYDLQPGVGKAGKMIVINEPYYRQMYLDRRTARVPAPIAELRSLIDPNYHVPQWMIALRPTVDKGYCIPDPLNWQRVADIVGVEFQKYLNEDIPASEALGRAKRQIDALYPS